MCVFYWPFEAIRVCLLRLAAMRVHQMRVLKMPQKLNLWSDRPGFYPRSHSIEPDISTVVSSPPVCIMRLKIWNVGKELVTWFQNSKFKRKRKSTEKTKDNFFFAWKDTSMSARIYQLCEAGEGAVRFLCFALFGIQMRPLSIVYMFILCLSTYCSPLT